MAIADDKASDDELWSEEQKRTVESKLRQLNLKYRWDTAVTEKSDTSLASREIIENIGPARFFGEVKQGGRRVPASVTGRSSRRKQRRLHGMDASALAGISINFDAYGPRGDIAICTRQPAQPSGELDLRQQHQDSAAGSAAADAGVDDGYNIIICNKEVIENNDVDINASGVVHFSAQQKLDNDGDNGDCDGDVLSLVPSSPVSIRTIDNSAYRMSKIISSPTVDCVHNEIFGDGFNDNGKDDDDGSSPTSVGMATTKTRQQPGQQSRGFTSIVETATASDCGADGKETANEGSGGDKRCFDRQHSQENHMCHSDGGSLEQSDAQHSALARKEGEKDGAGRVKPRMRKVAVEDSEQEEDNRLLATPIAEKGCGECSTIGTTPHDKDKCGTRSPTNVTVVGNTKKSYRRRRVLTDSDDDDDVSNGDVGSDTSKACLREMKGDGGANRVFQENKGIFDSEAGIACGDLDRELYREDAEGDTPSIDSLLTTPHSERAVNDDGHNSAPAEDVRIDRARELLRREMALCRADSSSADGKGNGGNISDPRFGHEYDPAQPVGKSLNMEALLILERSHGCSGDSRRGSVEMPTITHSQDAGLIKQRMEAPEATSTIQVNAEVVFRRKERGTSNRTDRQEERVLGEKRQENDSPLAIANNVGGAACRGKDSDASEEHTRQRCSIGAGRSPGSPVQPPYVELQPGLMFPESDEDNRDESESETRSIRSANSLSSRDKRERIRKRGKQHGKAPRQRWRTHRRQVLSDSEDEDTCKGSVLPRASEQKAAGSSPITFTRPSGGRCPDTPPLAADDLSAPSSEESVRGGNGIAVEETDAQIDCARVLLKRQMALCRADCSSPEEERPGENKSEPCFGCVSDDLLAAEQKLEREGDSGKVGSSYESGGMAPTRSDVSSEQRRTRLEMNSNSDEVCGCKQSSAAAAAGGDSVVDSVAHHDYGSDDDNDPTTSSITPLAVPTLRDTSNTARAASPAAAGGRTLGRSQPRPQRRMIVDFGSDDDDDDDDGGDDDSDSDSSAQFDSEKDCPTSDNAPNKRCAALLAGPAGRSSGLRGTTSGESGDELLHQTLRDRDTLGQDGEGVGNGFGDSCVGRGGSFSTAAADGDGDGDSDGGLVDTDSDCLGNKAEPVKRRVRLFLSTTDGMACAKTAADPVLVLSSRDDEPKAEGRRRPPPSSSSPTRVLTRVPIEREQRAGTDGNSRWRRRRSRNKSGKASRVDEDLGEDSSREEAKEVTRRSGSACSSSYGKTPRVSFPGDKSADDGSSDDYQNDPPGGSSSDCEEDDEGDDGNANISEDEWPLNVMRTPLKPSARGGRGNTTKDTEEVVAAKATGVANPSSATGTARRKKPNPGIGKPPPLHQQPPRLDTGGSRGTDGTTAAPRGFETPSASSTLIVRRLAKTPGKSAAGDATESSSVRRKPASLGSGEGLCGSSFLRARERCDLSWEKDECCIGRFVIGKKLHLSRIRIVLILENKNKNVYIYIYRLLLKPQIMGLIAESGGGGVRDREIGAFLKERCDFFQM